MKDSHAHLAITEAEWNQMAKTFKAILDKHKVPAREQDELFTIVGTTKADIVIGETLSRLDYFAASGNEDTRRVAGSFGAQAVVMRAAKPR
jgi:hemoglobin